MVSGSLASSRKSGSGGPEVGNEIFDKELNRELNRSREASRWPDLGNLALEAERQEMIDLIRN